MTGFKGTLPFVGECLFLSPQQNEQFFNRLKNPLEFYLKTNSEGRLSMIEAKDILTLLGIPSEKIRAFSSESCENASVVYIDLVDEKGCCPYCGSRELEIKGYYKVRQNNSVIKHRNIMVELNVRRYKCKKCNKTFKQNYDFAKKNDHISIAVKGAIIDDLSEKLTFTQIAKDHNTSINTVRRIFDSCILRQLALPLPEILCIDEFCFKHSSHIGKYPAVITNPLNGKIIDIVESRWQSVLIDYFNKVKVPQRKSVKYFVSDMNDTYRYVKKVFFKDATHIADRFHVIKAFNDAITAIRTRIIKQEVWQIEEYRYLKKNWKIFLKDRDSLKKNKTVNKWGIVVDPTFNLDKCLQKYPDLFYAYWTKEEFRKDTKKLLYYGKASEIIGFYINKLIENEIPEMMKVGKTLHNWRIEIINGITQNPYSIKISNGTAESINNTIQTLIDLSYGLPDFERIRKRVLYINRNQKD